MDNEEEYQRIVVPLDGSEAAEQSIALSEQVAQRRGTPLHLLRVADPATLPDLPSTCGFESVVREFVASEAMAREYLARVGTWLTKRGCTVTTEVRSGGAIRQILAAVRAGDVVVLSARGCGNRQDGLGSVAQGVVGQAPVPVVVLPGQQDDRDEP